MKAQLFILFLNQCPISKTIYDHELAMKKGLLEFVISRLFPGKSKLKINRLTKQAE
jgi:hypothetical protein